MFELADLRISGLECWNVRISRLARLTDKQYITYKSIWPVGQAD